MTVLQLLADLNQRGVELYLDGDRLRYRAPAGVLVPELRTAIGEQRSHIIEALRLTGAEETRSGPCTQCDPRNWMDESPRDNRIRTTCGICGRFIGYRPAEGRVPQMT